jgi:hypothetical protein
MAVHDVTETLDPALASDGNGGPAQAEERQPRSLTTAAARNLATTTKSVPQMQAISSRWLLRMLPWVQVNGGTYRVNRRLSYAVGSGRVSFAVTGEDITVIPPTLREIRPLATLDDAEALTALAQRFKRKEYRPGEVIAEAGRPADSLILIAHGKVAKQAKGKYGHDAMLGTLGDGAHIGEELLTGDAGTWAFTATAATPCITFAIKRLDLQQIARQYEPIRAQLAKSHNGHGPVNAHGEREIEIASGHEGEPALAGTYADYELKPREYELHVAQTVLHVHTRVADLYNDPMNQVEHQLRLTIEALRERQEHELINNPDIGLLHNADLTQRLHTRNGPPTPDDMDALLARRRKTRFFLAHPHAIAAFGRECTRRRIYPGTTEADGKTVHAWRGVPLLPCDKIPLSAQHTTSILALRTGEQDQGVIGLRQTGIADEYEQGLSVRFMQIDEQAIITQLVSAYYSAAILVPDALGVLEDVEVGH